MFVCVCVCVRACVHAWVWCVGWCGCGCGCVQVEYGLKEWESDTPELASPLGSSPLGSGYTHVRICVDMYACMCVDV